MNKQLRLTAICFAAAALVCAVTLVVARAQVAGNPPYALDQAVIASGGGQNSTGGNFSVDGTLGQTITGTRSTNQTYSIAGGFWTSDPLVPTAASVTISGRVLAPDGSGLRNARVVLTDIDGNTLLAVTGAFGYYRFDDIPAGQTVVIAVISKRFRFQPQAVTVMEELADLNFQPLP